MEFDELTSKFSKDAEDLVLTVNELAGRGGAIGLTLVGKDGTFHNNAIDDIHGTFLGHLKKRIWRHPAQDLIRCMLSAVDITSGDISKALERGDKWPWWIVCSEGQGTTPGMSWFPDKVDKIITPNIRASAGRFIEATYDNDGLKFTCRIFDQLMAGRYLAARLPDTASGELVIDSNGKYGKICILIIGVINGNPLSIRAVKLGNRRYHKIEGIMDSKRKLEVTNSLIESVILV